jgi:hypothetical protein
LATHQTSTHMKPILFIVALIIQAQYLNAQSIDCSTARKGKFELNSPASGITIIIRTDSTQTEINEGFNYEAILKVKWVDSCTYELTGKKIIKGDPSYASKPGDILKVEILRIDGNKIFIRSSSNYSSVVLERMLTKLE